MGAMFEGSYLKLKELKSSNLIDWWPMCKYITYFKMGPIAPPCGQLLRVLRFGL